MGGTGSGNYGGRPIVEQSLTLNISDLVQAYRATGGTGLRGTMKTRWAWSWANTGRPMGAVDFELELSTHGGELRINRTVRHDAWGQPVEGAAHTIRLETSQPHFGGVRWWFLCPRTCKRVCKVHLPLGARVFASRQAYRLGYTCQRESKRDQALRRARKARRKIGGSDNLSIRLPGKPKRMRWRTYERLQARALGAERRAVGISLAGLNSLRRQLGLPPVSVAA